MVFCGDWDLDKCIMIDFIKNLKYYWSSSRNEMVGKLPRNKDIRSSLYGVTYKQGVYCKKEKDENSNYFLSCCKSDYPHLQEIFEEFRDLYFPDFEFQNVQINKNYKCKPHFDSVNNGESILVCMGEYKGGLTCWYDEDETKKNKRIKKFDARIEPLLLDGSKHLHWVEDWTKGDRYSLVFFSGVSSS